MLEFERRAREILDRLPKDHPERRAIEGHVLLAENYNARAGLDSKETSTGVKRFSKDEEEALKRVGLRAIYTLTGETIQDQKDAGRKFRYIARSEGNRLMVLRSRLSQVAIDPRPNKFFLPKSDNITLNNQLEIIAEYSHELQKRLGTQTIEAIMGEAPDYTQLAFAHLDVTGERLFGEKYGFNYARTKTPTVGSSVAGVGRFRADDGLRVGRWYRDDGLGRVFAAPLVVPK